MKSSCELIEGKIGNKFSLNTDSIENETKFAFRKNKARKDIVSETSEEIQL